MDATGVMRTGLLLCSRRQWDEKKWVPHDEESEKKKKENHGSTIKSR